MIKTKSFEELVKFLQTACGWNPGEQGCSNNKQHPTAGVHHHHHRGGVRISSKWLVRLRVCMLDDL